MSTVLGSAALAMDEPPILLGVGVLPFRGTGPAGPGVREGSAGSPGTIVAQTHVEPTAGSFSGGEASEKPPMEDMTTLARRMPAYAGTVTGSCAGPMPAKTGAKRHAVAASSGMPHVSSCTLHVVIEPSRPPAFVEGTALSTICVALPDVH